MFAAPCALRQFEGPVERSVADQLVADAPQEYGWSMFKHNNDIVEGERPSLRFQGTGQGITFEK